MKSPSPPSRRGVTLIETIVSFSLLVTVLGVTAPLMVRHTRLLADGRAYRCAVDELSNRLATLAATPSGELAQAVADLPSEELDGPLTGAHLRGSIDAAVIGQRITLIVEWPEADRKRRTVTLTGWAIPPTPDAEAQR